MCYQRRLLHNARQEEYDTLASTFAPQVKEILLFLVPTDKPTFQVFESMYLAKSSEHFN